MEATDYRFTLSYLAPGGRARMVDIPVPAKAVMELSADDLCALFLVKAMEKLKETL